MVGVAFELHDTAEARHHLQSLSDDAARRSLVLRIKYQSIDPSFVDILMYSFCYIGLLTGKSRHVRLYLTFLYSDTGLQALRMLFSLSLIPSRGDVSPPQSSPVSSSCVVGR